MHKGLQNVLAALKSDDTQVSQLSLDHFSDLSSADLNSLRLSWPEIPLSQRLHLLRELGDREVLQFDLNFSNVYFRGLEDENPEVISLSIRNLSDTENRSILPHLLDLVSHPDHRVRSAAASALGFFVYLGELEEISTEDSARSVDALLHLQLHDPASTTRRCALESLGFSGHPNVHALILAALTSDDVEISVSAMRAIGRSADSAWEGHVLDHMHSLYPEMRLEAVRSAGELDLKEAQYDVIALLDDVDRDIRLAAIFSLAQIGGDDIEKLLSGMLEDCDDIEESDLLDDALNLLEFNKGIDDLLLFDLEPDEDDV